MLDLPEIPSPDFDAAQLDSMLELAKQRSGRLRRQRRSIATAIALSLVAVVTLASLVGLSYGTRRAHTALPRSKDTPGLARASVWKLVSDVTSGWAEITSSDYETGGGLTCPTATTCYAENAFVGQVEVTHDGGATWAQSTLPSGIELNGGGLACTDADTCSVLGQDVSGVSHFFTTTDGGQNWSSLPGPTQLSSGSLVSVLVCSTAASCLAVVSSGFALSTANGSGYGGPSTALVTTDGGESWSASDLPQGFDALSGRCSVGGNCLLTGFDEGSSAPGVVEHSSDGGSTWSPAAIPAGVGPLTQVSCGDPSDCYATEFGGAGAVPQSGVLATSDGGQTWSSTGSGDLPDSLLTSISCPSSSYCWASGVIIPPGTSRAITFTDAQGLLATTSDQGQTWQTAQLPTGVTAIGGISCPDTTTCFALGYSKPAVGRGTFVLLSYGG